MGAVAGDKASNDDDHSSGTSSAGNESEEDGLDKFIRRLGENYMGIDSFGLGHFSEMKWDHMEEDDRFMDLETRDDYEAVINTDIVRACQALRDNTVVREVLIDLLCVAGDGGECKVNDDGAMAIGTVLACNNAVKEVELAATCMRTVSGIRMVLRGIMQSATIKKLTITGHDTDAILNFEASEGVLGRNLTKILSELLAKSTTIEELVLESNPIYWDESLSILCDGLRKNRSVKNMSLLDNEVLSGHEIVEICKAVGMETRVKIDREFDENLHQIVCKCHNISELRCTFLGQDMTQSQYQDLASAFKHNASIKEIFLHNTISLKAPLNLGVLPILKTIGSLTKVEKIEFKHIPLNDNLMEGICSALSRSASLRDVYFDNCGDDDIHMSPQGAHYLANLLLGCDSIESIGLNYGNHEINDEGAIAVAQAVSERRGTTRELSFRYCGIGDQGATAFRQLLDSANTLEKLSIGGNHFSPAVIRSFGACLRRKASSLRDLDIGGLCNGWKFASCMDVQIHLVDSLKDNQILKHLAVPMGYDDSPSRSDKEEKNALRRKVLHEVLQHNHSVTDLSAYNCDDGEFHEIMREINKKHPILASTMKHAPFPVYLLKDMSGGKFANALARADNVAGIDGVFSLLRQVSGDAIGAGSDQKKRGREE